MQKIIVLSLLICTAHLPLSAQKIKSDTLSKEASRSLPELLKVDEMATKIALEGACKCIDSIKLSGKSKEKIAKDISACIHKEVLMYQMMKQTFAPEKNKKEGEPNVILISDDKNSPAYKEYYYELERLLRDSCQSLKSAAAANNLQNKNSVSNHPEALEYYNDALPFMSAEQFDKAITLLKKAVEKDPMFAFAWDNLGICYRKTGRYDDALAAYQKSLAADPEGITPLQNIAVVYEYRKDYNKAAGIYKSLTRQDRKNPEGFYGLARMYIFLSDFENALHQICIAYNLYDELQSPYRTDAENVISVIYDKMKKQDAEKKFYSILEEHQISVGSQK